MIGDFEDKKIFEEINNALLFGNLDIFFLKLRQIIEKNIYSLIKYLEIKIENIENDINMRLAIEKIKESHDPEIKKWKKENIEEIGKIYGDISDFIHFYGKNKINQVTLLQIEEFIKIILKLIYFIKEHKIENEENSEEKELLNKILNNFKNRGNYQLLTIEEIIKKYTIIIPEYQRNFSWNENKVFDFLKSKNFISKIYSSIDEKKRIWIIDGQQRILSILFFLKYLKMENNEIGCNILKEENFENFEIEEYKKYVEIFKKISYTEKIEEILNKKFIIHNFKIKEQGKIFLNINKIVSPLTEFDLFKARMLTPFEEITKQKEIWKELKNITNEYFFAKKYFGEKEINIIQFNEIRFEKILEIIEEKEKKFNYNLQEKDVNNILKEIKKIFLINLFIKFKFIICEKNKNNIDLRNSELNNNKKYLKFKDKLFNGENSKHRFFLILIKIIYEEKNYFYNHYSRRNFYFKNNFSFNPNYRISASEIYEIFVLKIIYFISTFNLKSESIYLIKDENLKIIKYINFSLNFDINYFRYLFFEKRKKPDTINQIIEINQIIKKYNILINKLSKKEKRESNKKKNNFFLKILKNLELNIEFNNYISKNQENKNLKWSQIKFKQDKENKIIFWILLEKEKKLEININFSNEEFEKSVSEINKYLRKNKNFFTNEIKSINKKKKENWNNLEKRILKIINKKIENLKDKL